MPETVPIEDDEFIYRRIPVSQDWYNSSISGKPAADAFKPHRRNDPDGLSVSRAKSVKHPDFLSIEAAANGPSRCGYFVAVLRVGDLRQHGIEVIADWRYENPGHALLPGLNTADRKSDHVLEHMYLLAEKLTIRLEGPFVIDYE